MVKLYLAGAHTAVSRAFVECLDDHGLLDAPADPGGDPAAAGVRSATLQLVKATTIEHLDEELVLLDEAGVATADLVVLGLRGPIARAVAEGARRRAVPVLDLAGELAGEKRARYLFPGLDPTAGAAFDPEVFALIPLGLAAPVVAVLRALAPLGPTRATIATYESTAAFDQPGMDALSDEVRARFAMRDVEPGLFGGPIAFGCLPSLAAPGQPPFDADEELVRAIEAGVERELPDLELSVARVLVPTFSADAAVMFVDLDEGPAEEAVRSALRAGRTLAFLGDELPSSIDAVGREDVQVGRLSLEPGRLSLWLASDRLRRGGATLAALAIERWLGGSPKKNGAA